MSRRTVHDVRVASREHGTNRRARARFLLIRAEDCVSQASSQCTVALRRPLSAGRGDHLANREKALGTTTGPAPKSKRKPRRRRPLAARTARPKLVASDRALELELERALATTAVERSLATTERSFGRAWRPGELDRAWRAYARRGDDASRNRLVEAYQPLLADIVRRFASRLPRNVDRGDLDTAANFGLMSAIEGFDPERGVRFETYCELRVKGALLDELRNLDWLSRPCRARFEQHKRVCERLRAENGRDPDDEEIARGMEMPLELYRQLFSVGLPGAPGVAVGASPAAEGDDAPPGLEVVPDTHSDAPGDKLSRDELLRLVAQKLTVQEYRIVYLKYWEELSMREIGELMRLSESRVCKIHTRLLERLQDRFRVDAE
jgi:RNA polymerase sigma factor for flagellar operon FliA